ncbi:MAG: hypothetical protein V3T99_05425 [Nitrososphaerales archaeon]
MKYSSKGLSSLTIIGLFFLISCNPSYATVQKPLTICETEWDGKELVFVEENGEWYKVEGVKSAVDSC